MIYKVTFQYSDSVYCSNIAISDNSDKVKDHYSKYSWYDISAGNDNDLRSAELKGMPIIKL